MNKILSFITSVSLLALVGLGSLLSPSKAHAAAVIVITKVYISDSNTVYVNLDEGHGNLVSVDFSKWHIDINTGGVSPLNPTSATIGEPAFGNGVEVILHFAGTPFLATDSAYDASHGLYVDALGATDEVADTNVVVGHASSIAISDGQSPAVSSISIASDGSNPAYAKVGSSVTVTFTASELIDEVASNPAFYTNGGNPVANDGVQFVFVSGTTYQFSYTPHIDDVAGLVEFEFMIFDIPGGESPIYDQGDITDASSVTFDKTAPVISEVTPVTTPTADTTPDYTFTSSEEGTIAYGGSCTSAETSATVGSNTITFDALGSGTYTDCTITVADLADNDSNTLAVTSFTVTVANITILSASVLSSDTIFVRMSNPNFSPAAAVDASKWHVDINDGGTSPLTPISATIIPGGPSPRFTITFSGTPFSDPATEYDAAHGLYADANAFTDAATNTNVVVAHGDSVAIGDGQIPELVSVSIESDGADPEYAKVGDEITLTFEVSEAIGDWSITINGTDVSGTLATVTGTTYAVTRTMLSGDTEGVMTFDIGVADNTGNPLSENATDTTDDSSVTFDKTAPTISEVTPVVTPAEDTTPSYTFTTNQAGTISYSGSCASATTSATVGSNTITFSTLAVGTYTDCTITVTDVADNDSNTLAVTSFTITAAVAPSPSPSSSNSGAGGYTTNLNDIPYATGTTVTQPTPSPFSCAPYLTTFLSRGDRNENVTKLQMFLASQNLFTYPTFTTFFGPVTFQAVKDFQVKFASDILAPIGLTSPTGFVGPMTLAKINAVSCQN